MSQNYREKSKELCGLSIKDFLRELLTICHGDPCTTEYYIRNYLNSSEARK